MILVIGGYAAGKRAYVSETLGFAPEEMSTDPTDSAPVLYNLQDCGLAPTLQTVALLLQKQVVLCNEVGCGLVPMSAEERQRREDVGRLCILLAQKAAKVVRVCCGIGTVIKEESQ